jgi:hypothetical protein
LSDGMGPDMLPKNWPRYKDRLSRYGLPPISHLNIGLDLTLLRT